MGECFVILSNWSFAFTSKVFSRFNAVDWEYPKMPNVKEFSLEVKFLSPNLLVVFNVKFLTLAPNKPFFPVSLIRTSVVKLLYPIPVLITTVSTIKPLEITGLIIAPEPEPVDIISRSGIELYWLPLFVTFTSSIFPLLITALNSAFFPLSINIFGFIWWLRILDP